MPIMARVAREYLLQFLSFAIVMADRILIPGALLRHLGVGGFAGWSVALAWAAFIPALDFGVTRYFTNRLLIARASGNEDEALMVFRQGTMLVALLTIPCTAGFLLFLHLVPPKSGDAIMDADLLKVLLPPIAAMLLQQLLAIRKVLYRAHQQFARETLLIGAFEIIRITVLLAAIFASADLVTLSWVWLIIVFIFQVIPFAYDSRRRFPRFVEGPVSIDAQTRDSLIRVAPGFWLQTMSTTLFASLPIIALGFMATTPLVIAQFGLMRTIANLVRQVLQLFANVFGLELSRRLGAQDHEGLASVFLESNRLLGVQAAIAAGVLIIMGPELVYLWSGNSQVFDVTMLLLAIAAPILLPCAILSVETLTYANRPWVLVGYRLTQLLLSVVAFLLMPIADTGMRMMAALAIGEVVGFCVPILLSIRALETRLALRRQLAISLYSLAALGLTILIMLPVRLWPPATFTLRMLEGGALAGLAALLVLPVLALSGERRMAAWAMVRVRLRR